MTCDVCRSPVTQDEVNDDEATRVWRGCGRGWRHWACDDDLAKRRDAARGPWRTAP